MRKLEKAIIEPRFYVIWAALVVVALLTTYFQDPYIFAFTTFGLGGISAVVGLMGVSAALLSKAASFRAKASIIASVAAAAAASVLAFVILGRFNWA